MSCEILQRQTTFWDFRDNDYVVWRVDFVGKEEFYFLTATVSSFSILDHHPLLLDYHHPWLQIFLSGPATAPGDVASSLESSIAEHTGPWRAPTHYLNPIGPIELLKSGSGQLLAAPVPIAEACVEVLRQSKVPFTVLPGRPVRGSRVALLAGPNYVVAEKITVASVA